MWTFQQTLPFLEKGSVLVKQAMRKLQVSSHNPHPHTHTHTPHRQREFTSYHALLTVMVTSPFPLPPQITIHHSCNNSSFIQQLTIHFNNSPNGE
jgi:hypothetical protein